MKPTIKQNEAQPIAPEIIATAIIEIADAMKAINQCRLSRRAIVALIHDRSKLKKIDIEIVLNNLTDLAKNWTK